MASTLHVISFVSDATYLIKGCQRDSALCVHGIDGLEDAHQHHHAAPNKAPEIPGPHFLIEPTILS